jgi:hypothetical protein
MVVKGPYSLDDWETMLNYKFRYFPHMERQNKKFNGRYEDRINREKERYKEYLLKEVA